MYFLGWQWVDAFGWLGREETRALEEIPEEPLTE